MFVLNGNGEKILRMLKSCGLTEYESKAYFTLLVSGEAKAWDIYRKSSVPASKIYGVLETLREKGLVDIKEQRPKLILPREFRSYVNDKIREKKNEIESLKEIRNRIGKTVSVLKPVAMKYARYGVFEPKYRRR